MPVSVKTYTTLGEAGAALAAERGSRYIGGGPLVMRALNEGDLTLSSVVRVTDRNLQTLRANSGRVVIGAGVTLARILAERDLAFLHAAARSIGGPAVRNMGTVGGNLFAPSPFGDLSVALRGVCAALFLDETRAKPRRRHAAITRSRIFEPYGASANATS